MAAGQVMYRSPEGTQRSAAEVAGGTAAECAAVACCCPCAVVELVVLAFYKFPAELCKKAWRKNKRRRLAKRRKALLMPGPPADTRNHSPLAAATTTASVYEDALDLAVVRNDVAERESVCSSHVDEAWPDFYRTGFWRSPDRDEDDI